MLERCRC